MKQAWRGEQDEYRLPFIFLPFFPLLFIKKKSYNRCRPDGVVEKVLVLEQGDEVFDGGAKVAADDQLAQRRNHGASRVLARVAPREHMAKLRVGKLVQAARRADCETGLSQL